MPVKETRLSWVFLAATTLITFLEIGTIKAFGVLLPHIKEQLVTETWIVGSCLSIISGFGYILGLSASSLTRSFGPRVCVIVSGLTASVGLIIAACTTSVPMLLLGLLLTGFLLLNENVVMGSVPQYFNRYYELAFIVNSLAYPLAIMIMPPVTQALVETYGWRGALVVLTALNLHAIPCGALLKQRKDQQTNSTKTALLPAADHEPAREWNARHMSRKLGIHLLNNAPFIFRVVLPEFVFGFTFSGWMIYIISFAISNGASIKGSTIVATSGGIGMSIIKIVLPFLSTLMTYNQLMYMSCLIEGVGLALTTLTTGVLGMSIASVIFGIGISILGTEVYIAVKDTVDEVDFVHAVSWCHMFCGVASIMSGTLTGLIFEFTGGFTVPFAILAGISLMTAVALGVEDICRRTNAH